MGAGANSNKYAPVLTFDLTFLESNNFIIEPTKENKKQPYTFFLAKFISTESYIGSTYLNAYFFP